MPKAARLITCSYESKEMGMRGRDTTQLSVAKRLHARKRLLLGTWTTGHAVVKILAHSVIAFYLPMLHALAPHLFYAVNGVRAVTAAADHHL